jgi:competence protein ComEC
VLGALLWINSIRTGNPDTRPETTGKPPLLVGLNISRRMKWILLTLLLAAVLVTGTAFNLPDGKLHVSFLNVGEGDAILIEKGNTQILVDGGPDSRATGVELSKKMPFWDRTIDMVILTHPHQDHLAGLVTVVQNYRVEKVMYADTDYVSPLYDEWLGLIREKDIEVLDALAGMQIDMGDGVFIQVLGPPAPPYSGTASDADNNSIVLRLCCGESSFLLCGDIMRQAELDLVFSRAELASTVLKVPHHGSDTSTTPEFLAVVNPQLAVISVGSDNKFGHPDEEVMDRLGQQVGLDNIYRTDIDGTIEFITDGSRLWVDTGS